MSDGPEDPGSFIAASAKGTAAAHSGVRKMRDEDGQGFGTIPEIVLCNQPVPRFLHLA